MDRDLRHRAADRRALDRLTHHVNILEMNGEIYRLAQRRARKSTKTD
jgi:DNA replication protein DnaC